MVKILPLNEKIIDLALIDNTFSDFEDALQYFIAIQNQQNVIITRDLNDFKKSKLPIMRVEEFLASIN